MRIQVVAIEGEAEIGKTRLVEEFLRWVTLKWADVLWGRGKVLKRQSNTRHVSNRAQPMSTSPTIRGGVGTATRFVLLEGVHPRVARYADEERTFVTAPVTVAGNRRRSTP